MHITIITLFPSMIQEKLLSSTTKDAIANNKISYDIVNLRDYGIGKHKKVDHIAYGGGDIGLIIKPDVLGGALDDCLYKKQYHYIIYPSPHGLILDNFFISSIKHKNIIIVCGRFEGIDYRIIEHYNILQVSIGDFILSGGELPALLIIDAIGSGLINKD